MIAQLTGTVVDAALDRLVVDVGGVGYAVRTPPSVRARVGERVTVHTHLAVTDDALTLYGFADAHERELFLAVTGVTGFGPKLALAAVGALGADRLRAAVAAEDVAALTAVPGVGKKGAQRLVLELRERLGTPEPSGDGLPTTAPTGARAEVHQALASLGYAADEAHAAVAAVADDVDDPEHLLRAALQQLGSRA